MKKKTENLKKKLLTKHKSLKILKNSQKKNPKKILEKF